MTTGYRNVYLLASMILLAGCTQSHDVAKLQKQVVVLEQMLGTLTSQHLALERQNRLNLNATNGVYLLPAASSAVKLDSRVGELSLFLNYVKDEANGSKAALYVRTLSGQYLPDITAIVEWGQLDATTGMPLTADAQSQFIRSRSSLLPKNEHVFELHLNGLTRKQLGYIRVHSIAPVTATAQRQ